MKTKRKLILAGIFLLVFAGVSSYIKKEGSIRAPLMEVTPGPFSKTFIQSGESIPAIEQTIYSLQGGQVAQVLVEEGQGVQKGDLLAMLEDVELQLQVSQLEGQLKSLQGEETQWEKALPLEIESQKLVVDQAKLDLENLEADQKRAKVLYKEGALTEVDYHEARRMVEDAKINLQLQEQALRFLEDPQNPGAKQIIAGRTDALKAQIEALKYQIEKCKIIAPMQGVVANLDLRAGELINPGDHLMDIFQKEKYLVQVHVDSREVRGLLVGDLVAIYDDRSDGDKQLKGKIKSIAPTAKGHISALGLLEPRVKVSVEPLVQEGVEWYPGNRVDVQFTRDYQEDVLTVPRTALFHHEGKKALWIVEEGRAQIRTVKVDIENPQEAVVVEGLSPGDIIISNPVLSGLRPGRRIQRGK